MKLKTGSAMAAACAGLMAGTASAAESHFDAGDEGWTFAEVDFAISANPPHVAAVNPLAWKDTGGHPGGYVEITRDPSPLWNWFSAPAAFLGDQSALYGGTLTYDLIDSAGGAGSEILPAVMLVGAGTTLYINSGWPDDAWTSYSIMLKEAGWYTDFFDPAGSPATQAEFQAVLADVQGLYIDGDWTGVPNSMGLDNVVMTPAPGSLALAGLAIIVARRRRV